MSRFEGKVAVVTGGSNGIGFATAQHLAEAGARVFITGRRQGELDAAAKKLGSHATAVQGDVGKASDLDRLYAKVGEAGGRLDILFANAGIYNMSSLHEATEEHFDSIFGINVKGLLLTVQKALPLLNDGASIILNGSVASQKGIENMGVYSASKAAVRSFARTWSIELAKRAIRVNVISPGPIRTEGFNSSFGLSTQQMDEMADQMGQLTTLKRIGRPDEIAKAVLFLASDDSSYMTGADLFVDGGFGQV